MREGSKLAANILIRTESKLINLLININKRLNKANLIESSLAFDIHDLNGQYMVAIFWTEFFLYVFTRDQGSTAVFTFIC